MRVRHEGRIKFQPINNIIAFAFQPAPMSKGHLCPDALLLTKSRLSPEVQYRLAQLDHVREPVEATCRQLCRFPDGRFLQDKIGMGFIAKATTSAYHDGRSSKLVKYACSPSAITNTILIVFDTSASGDECHVKSLYLGSYS